VLSINIHGLRFCIQLDFALQDNVVQDLLPKLGTGTTFISSPARALLLKCMMDPFNVPSQFHSPISSLNMVSTAGPFSNAFYQHPVHRTLKIPFSTSRTFIERSRRPFWAGGIKGSTIANDRLSQARPRA
jgi:hypothetical protein